MSVLNHLQRFFDPPNAEPDRAPRRIFWTALIVRLLYITLAHTYRIRPANDHFEFGWEMGRIARSLSTGFGYADPFEGHTGPTAWTPPLYPLLLAAVFKLFGVYTRSAAWVILALNSVFSAATALAIFQIARRAFASRKDAYQIALWSAWLWALYPAALQYAVRWVWDMSLTAFLFACVFALVLRLRMQPERPADTSRHPGAARISVVALRLWVVYGFLWGLIALSNSSVLVFLPFCTFWILWPNRSPGTPSQTVPSFKVGSSTVRLRNVTLAALTCLLVVSPWIVRNQRAFHAFIPLRSNFGAELYESAQLENEGYPTMATLPHTTASPEFRRYQALGELAYSREQGNKAKAIIRAHPGIFAAHILKRVWFFWVSVPHPDEPAGLRGILKETGREMSYAFLSLCGLFGLALALRHRREIPAAWLFFWAFAVMPLLYYVVTVQARFRHPLEPLICILAVYLFRSAQPRKSTQRG